jgi:hypothetical protein
MAGGFTLGERDPAVGARRGAASGHTLDLRARVVIPDVRRFVADPQHAGTLDATIAFAPLGGALAAHAGHVRLFTPTPDPDLKRMEYRAVFTCDGRTYCLDGAKTVRRGSVLRAWGATTTLPCRLHEGADDRGAVAGAGVLRLSAARFAAQLTSFRAMHPASAADGAMAFARFFRFFAAELIDTYVTGGGR